MATGGCVPASRPGTGGGYDVCESLDALTIYAPTRKIEHRGHTLRPLVTIRLSSPLRTSSRPPDATSRASPTEAGVLARDGAGARRGVGDRRGRRTHRGSLTVRVGRDGEWRIDFEPTVGFSPRANQGHRIVETEGHHYMVEQLGWVGERVYGLGERFGPPGEDGSRSTSGTRTAERASEQAYKNIPFY